MYEFIREYKFEKDPGEIKYLDGEPLKLTKSFCFYHNKNFFRKELNRLQYIFKDFLNIPLLAAGIRDTYLKEEYSENYLILLFTDVQTHKKANELIEQHLKIPIDKCSFYLVNTSTYMLLLAKDLNGLISGIDVIEIILKQTLEDYFNQKRFEDYIKIRPFVIKNYKRTS
ncbi:MAG: hypothetical protein ACTSQJ_14670 [Promethearchaeota archaeon]